MSLLGGAFRGLPAALSLSVLDPRLTFSEAEGTAGAEAGATVHRLDGGALSPYDLKRLQVGRVCGGGWGWGEDHGMWRCGCVCVCGRVGGRWEGDNCIDLGSCLTFTCQLPTLSTVSPLHPPLPPVPSRRPPLSPATPTPFNPNRLRNPSPNNPQPHNPLSPNHPNLNSEHPELTLN